MEGLVLTNPSNSPSRFEKVCQSVSDGICFLRQLLVGHDRHLG